MLVLVSAVSFGISDFVGGIASRRVPALLTAGVGACAAVFGGPAWTIPAGSVVIFNGLILARVGRVSGR